VIASLEYGVAQLNTTLLMVLGHQRCGAVTAAVNALDTKSAEEGDLGYLVDALAPAIRQVSGQPGDRVTHAVRANVALTPLTSVNSPVLGQLSAKAGQDGRRRTTAWTPGRSRSSDRRPRGPLPTSTSTSTMVISKSVSYSAFQSYADSAAD